MAQRGGGGALQFRRAPGTASPIHGLRVAGAALRVAAREDSILNTVRLSLPGAKLGFRLSPLARAISLHRAAARAVFADAAWPRARMITRPLAGR
jgi:hypothetical protein